MGALADIFAAVRLQLDGTGFEAQATALATKSGKNVGDQMSQQLNAKLKTAVRGAIGAGAGLALGAMANGALELDAATRQLQTDTGMTADEADRAKHALAGMFRNNLQGFDEIGAAMAAVHNDLGLVGDAADKATAKFLKFSTATGQDAAAAVTAFDDILDAWNLTAADAAPIMDKLIASHGKYGGSITENQKALGELAPQLRALGVEVDGGIALLNLFAASGLDSSKATFALNTAVRTLKPGQDLDDLIAQIVSIEDPTLRAQKAIEIFGARGGVSLANALRPGMAGLDDFAVSLEESAGATDEAAKAIEDSVGNKAKMALKGFQATLAEVGTSFGDLLMVAAMLGPGLTKRLMAGIGGIAGMLLPKIAAQLGLTLPAFLGMGTAQGAAAATAEVTAQTTGVVAGQAAVGAAATPAAAAAGTGIGTAMGVAVGVGLAAAAGVGIALAFKAVVLDPGLQQQTRDIGKAVGEQIATGTLEQLTQSKGALEKGIADINALPLGGFLYGDQVRDLQTQLDAVNAKLLAGGTEMPQSVATGIEQTAPVVEIAVEDLVKTLGTSMSGVLVAAKATGADGMLAMAQGITAARAKPLDAFSTLKEMLKHALSPMGEIARLHGQLTSKSLAKGLKSADPAVRAQAIAVAKAAADRLGELAAGGGKAGKAAMAELDKGIRSKIPAVRDASLAAKEAAVAQLNATVAPAGTAGAAAGAAFAARLKASVKETVLWVNAQGAPSGLIPVASHASGTPFVPRDMLSFIHHGEIIVPEEASDAIRGGRAMLGQPGAATTGRAITVNVYNPRPEPASTSTRRELRKLALSGSAA